MMKMRKFLSMALALSMVAGVLAGCGQGKTADSTEATEVTEATEITEAAAGTEGASAEYVDIKVGVTLNWDTLTPFRSNIANDAYCSKVIYEALASIEADGEYHPWIAKSWSTNDGGYTYDFEIYDYITDSQGNKITADDLVWMIEESVKANLKPNFANVESVEKTGDYSFSVKLKSNQVGVLESLLTDVFAVSKSAYEASADGFATSCVTTSAYVLSEYISGVSMTFEKRSDYWQTDASLIPASCVANVDKMTLMQISEASQMGIALESGDIDIALELGANTAIQFEGNDDFVMETFSKPNGHQMFFSGAPTSVVAEDQNLRQAICYAIDVNGILASVYAGYGTVMHDTCSETAYGYLTKWNDESYYDYDPEKAKELLAESNYNGETLTILCSSSFQNWGEMVMNYLLAVGINAKLDSGDIAYVTSIRLDGTKYDMFLNQVGCATLPSQWSIRFDPAAYKTGDGTSRHDYELAEMLYKTWTADGFTEENIDAVHNYIKEHAYAYGMVCPSVINVWRSDVNLQNYVAGSYNKISVQACTFSK